MVHFFLSIVLRAVVVVLPWLPDTNIGLCVYRTNRIYGVRSPQKGGSPAFVIITPPALTLPTPFQCFPHRRRRRRNNDSK